MMDHLIGADAERVASTTICQSRAAGEGSFLVIARQAITAA
jgi:hypothetical protein